MSGRLGAPGWRVASRIAFREAARDRGQSVFIWVMVAVPIAAVCALLVLLYSQDVSAHEELDLKLAGHQAVLTHLPFRVEPEFDGVGSSEDNGNRNKPAAKIPGWGSSVSSQVEAVQRLIDRPVTMMSIREGEAGPARVGVTVAGTQVRPGSPGVSLRSGRMPVGGDEVAVTPLGETLGLPVDGQLDLRDGGTPRSVTVVGRVEVSTDMPVALVSAPNPARGEVRFLADGDPLGWDDATKLARYGFVVSSRQIEASPPYRVVSMEQASRNFYSSLISAGVLAEVGLIVGPAFAISAARRRRQLALLAVNGATTAQLRAVAIGQGVLLGGTAAVVGGLLGTLLGLLGWFWLPKDLSQLQGPLEVPVGLLLLVLGLGIAAPVTAALVSARGLARLDLLEAYRSASTPNEVVGRRRLLAGATTACLGVGFVFAAPQVKVLEGSLTFWLWCIGALAVVIGSILLLPGLLRVLSLLVRNRRLAFRMAAQEASRSHRRSVATLAAVLAGALLTTTLWTIVLSFERNEARLYRPSVPVGQGSIVTPTKDPDWGQLATALKSADPELKTAQFEVVTGYRDKGAIAVVPPRCSVNEVFSEDKSPGCGSLNTNSDLFGSAIMSGSIGQLTESFGLNAEQQQVLKAGGLLINTDPPRDALWATNKIKGGKVKIAELTPNGRAQTITVPASPLDGVHLFEMASPRIGALVATESSTALEWSGSSPWLQLIPTDASIDSEREALLRRKAHQWDPAAIVEIEHGYQPQPQPLLWVATSTAALLAVIAAVIATILSIRELRPYRLTLTAVGASPEFLTRFAASQSAGLAALGTIVGSLVGVVVAAPLVLAVTGVTGLSPTLAVPWLVILAQGAAIPVVSGVVAVRIQARTAKREAVGTEGIW